MFETINEAVQAAIPTPSTAAPQPSQFANVPPTYTSPLTGQEFNNAGYTPPATTEGQQASSGADYEALYLQQKDENNRLNAILKAARVAPSSAPGQRVQAAVTADRVKATVSPTAFLKMSREDKIRALGLDPATVTDDGLRKAFGRGADTAIGTGLMNANPRRYAELKQAALLLNIYGA